MADTTEYCVMRDGDTDEPHRGPWTQHQCEMWIQEWDDMVSDPARIGMFYVARRTVSPWERDK